MEKRIKLAIYSKIISIISVILIILVSLLYKRYVENNFTLGILYYVLSVELWIFLSICVFVILLPLKEKEVLINGLINGNSITG
jgi:hypothetical protein